MAKVQNGLYDHVTDAGWFRANPKSVRAAWHATGIVLVVAGAILGFFAFAAGASVARHRCWSPSRSGHRHRSSRSWATPPPPAPPTAPPCSRSPWVPPLPGHRRGQPAAVRGGRGHLQPVPARTRSCSGWPTAGRACSASSPRRVVPFEQPGWYVGGYYPGANIYWATAFASSLDRFAAVATESISAPTPGTSGGSGFSGGGFSGGGVGGGGGGGWYAVRVEPPGLAVLHQRDGADVVQEVRCRAGRTSRTAGTPAEPVAPALPASWEPTPPSGPGRAGSWARYPVREMGSPSGNPQSTIAVHSGLAVATTSSRGPHGRRQRLQRHHVIAQTSRERFCLRDAVDGATPRGQTVHDVVERRAQEADARRDGSELVAPEGHVLAHGGPSRLVA